MLLLQKNLALISYSKTESSKISRNFVGSLNLGNNLEKIWNENSKLKHDLGHFLECRPDVRRDYSHGDYVDGGDVLLTRSTTVDEGISDLNGHNRVPPIFLFFLEGENRGSFPSHSDDRCVKEFVDNFSKMMTFNFICLTLFEADLYIEVHS